MVRGLSQRPNLTEGPAATWDLRRSTKEEEEEALVRRSPINSLSNVTLSLIWKPVVKQFIQPVNAIKGCTSMLCTSVLFRM
jgi:hypothetical protein